MIKVPAEIRNVNSEERLLWSTLVTVLKRPVYSADEFMNMDKAKRNDLIMEDLQVSSKLFTKQIRPYKYINCRKSKVCTIFTWSITVTTTSTKQMVT